MDSTDGNISADGVAKLSVPLFALFFFSPRSTLFLSLPLVETVTRFADTIVPTFFAVSSLHTLPQDTRS